MLYDSRIVSFFLLCSLITFSLQANESKNETPLPIESKAEVKSESVTQHTVSINGKPLQYQAMAGTLALKSDQNKPKADIFYIAYFKNDIKNKAERPLIFCFNGGPGSSSVWLHLGILGPKRVILNDDKSTPPYRIIDNAYTLLDVADLVFIDPVSTGYSRAAPGEDAKQFHGVEEDIESIAEFIREFITKYERWDSPKFLAGESYGTTRAAGLADQLQDQQRISINGIIFISTILNFQTVNDSDKGNDLPYALYLPTYTATAWYHKRLSDDLQKDFNKTLELSKQFATNEYALALMKGSLLSSEENEKIAQKLASLTGLKVDFIKRSNLRINPYRFEAELLRNQNLTIGRFDSRITGYTLDTSCDFPNYDPSLDLIIGAFTAGINQYARQDLKVNNPQEYKILADVCSSWYNKTTNQYLNMSSSLHDVMIKNPTLKVFVGSGYYDLATPFFATDYTFNHLRLPEALQKNIHTYYYTAGHMMYTSESQLDQLNKDLHTWLQSIHLPPSPQ